MGKKKKNKKDEIKPWCYYCDRIFNDEATLVQHQKSKHFKCGVCNRKLNTAQGLAVHSYQVHKETVSAVPGAKEERASMEVEIFGMAGVPEGMRPGGIVEEEPALKKAKVVDVVPLAPPPPIANPSYILSSALPSLPTATNAGAMPQIMPPAHMPSSAPPLYSTPYAPYPAPGRPPVPQYMVPPVQQYNGPPPGGPTFQPRPMPDWRPGIPPPGLMHTGMPPSMHPLGPLFPVSRPPAGIPGLGPYPGAPPALFPIRPQSQVAPPSYATPGPIPTQSLPDSDLVWTDADTSMEETRARLPKYAALASNGESFAGFS